MRKYNLVRDTPDSRDLHIHFTTETINYSIYDPPIVVIKPSTWFDIIKAKIKSIKKLFI